MVFKFLQVAAISFVFTLILDIVCFLPMIAAFEYLDARDEKRQKEEKKEIYGSKEEQDNYGAKTL